MNDLTAHTFRDSVMKLQEQMLTLPQVEVPLIHRFAPGVYAREATIPAGQLVIGKIHKSAHMNFLTKGEITVITETGTVHLVAPCTFVSPPFTKKAAYTHTEVVWTNVIPTDETDPDVIESQITCESYDDPAFLEYVTKSLEGVNICLSSSL